MLVQKRVIEIGLIDDHPLFLRSVGMLINSIPGFQVTMEACDSTRLLQLLANAATLPDIMLIDVNLPGDNGARIAQQLSSIYPQIRLAAFSARNDDRSIINMIRAGCGAYLVKDIHPDELQAALREIAETGYYNRDAYNLTYNRRPEEKLPQLFELTEKEAEFLTLACSDLTYKQIATKMRLSERTIDGYRESVFHKMQVKSRVGMVLAAVRQQLVPL